MYLFAIIYVCECVYIAFVSPDCKKVSWCDGFAFPLHFLKSTENCTPTFVCGLGVACSHFPYSMCRNLQGVQCSHAVILIHAGRRNRWGNSLRTQRERFQVVFFFEGDTGQISSCIQCVSKTREPRAYLWNASQCGVGGWTMYLTRIVLRRTKERSSLTPVIWKDLIYLHLLLLNLSLCASLSNPVCKY